MWELLEEVFEEIGIDYSRQGSYSVDDELPESFFTFWNTSSVSRFLYDDDSKDTHWSWYIYFYTKNPTLIYSKLEEFITIARAKGFYIDGEGQDIPTDNVNYIGRMVAIEYVATKK